MKLWWQFFYVFFFITASTASTIDQRCLKTSFSWNFWQSWQSCQSASASTSFANKPILIKKRVEGKLFSRLMKKFYSVELWKMKRKVALTILGKIYEFRLGCLPPENLFHRQFLCRCKFILKNIKTVFNSESIICPIRFGRMIRKASKKLELLVSTFCHHYFLP